jgi:SAM-dependent methyltransferase
MDSQIKALFEATTRPYIPAGKYAWHYARGKLRHDPVYFALLRSGVFPDRGSLLDLGCGQGIVLSLLEAAKAQYRAGAWPRDWPAPPLNLDLQGLELREDRVQAAHRALGSSVRVDRGDLRKFDFRPCSAIVLLDVLHYIGDVEQRRVLDRAASALDPGGCLVLRETDASAGLKFWATTLGERFSCALDGQFVPALHYRGAVQWIAELAERGFAVTAEPMFEGTPFANVLFVARKVSD